MTGIDMRADADYAIHGLLYIDRDHCDHANLRSRGENPIDIYIKCAALCSASVKAHGHRFRLVANDAGFLRERADTLGLNELDIVEHAFTRAIPRGLPFYAAHFKLDLLEAFGTGAYGSCVGLVDIDTVLCRPLALPPLSPYSLAAYDISDQIFPEHGVERVRHDLERVAGQRLASIRWYGGEFLFGDHNAFRELSLIIAECWPRYLSAVSCLHHVGDEMIVSAALNIASRNTLSVVDAAGSAAVVRWWSARTGFRQRPLSDVRHHSFIHLPSDKPFLSRYTGKSFQDDAFVSAYRRYVRRKLLARHCYNAAMQILGKPKKFVGRIGSFDDHAC